MIKYILCLNLHIIFFYKIIVIIIPNEIISILLGILSRKHLQINNQQRPEIILILCMSQVQLHMILVRYCRKKFQGLTKITLFQLATMLGEQYICTSKHRLFNRKCVSQDGYPIIAR